MTGIALAILCAAGFAISPAMAREAASNEVLFDFSKHPALRCEQRELADVVCEMGPAPGVEGRDVFTLTWPAHSGPHISAYLVEAGQVLIDEPGKYKITARICGEQLGAECMKLGLRLNDVGLENFQLFTPITHGEPGWVEVTWMLDTENPAEGGSAPWGGDEDKKMDMPIRLRGFALPFADWKTNGGAISIDQIKIERISE